MVRVGEPCASTPRRRHMAHAIASHRTHTEAPVWRGCASRKPVGHKCGGGRQCDGATNQSTDEPPLSRYRPFRRWLLRPLWSLVEAKGCLGVTQDVRSLRN